ncbi:diguanylate cyclase [Halarcobacter ebronensis]|uniref:Diguanylate cyclase n=1 Tax=Halarcobacter ebronensis TaxID=1462615 RepID=A0A4Q0YDH1_9BACT|nr:bifunctional diguanylate cyclase/phosphodiesterase [Halarcobacter ebronensis]RXJ68510.1 diguanylate cyclase [Halarcobacter ebronensis]
MENELSPRKVTKYPVDTFANQVDALVYTVDMETQEILFCNEKCMEEFGNIIGKKCHDLLEKVSVSSYLDSFDDIHWGEDVSEYMHSLSNRIYLFSEKIVEDYKKLKKVKVRVGVDVTTKKSSGNKSKDKNLKNSDAIEAILDATIEGIFVYDEKRKCIKVNDVASKIFCYTKDEILGKDVSNFVDQTSVPTVREILATGYEEPYEATMIRKNGEKFPCILRGKYIYLNNEKVRVVAILDISNVKEKEGEIVKLAFYDSLTKLPNKVLLKDRVEQLLTKFNRTNHYGGLIIIDLDHFKNINDTKGHFIGDRVLVEFAKRLQTLIRRYDTISRFGGDEFIVLINTEFSDRIKATNSIKEIAKKILKNIKKSFKIDEDEYILTASIGISIFDKNFTYDEILKCADSAMNFAKKRGRDNYNFFDSKLQLELERKAIITTKLRDAIRYNQISIVYQKQVHLDKKVVGVEALARWEDEELGLVSPNEFIPIAEESGLIIEFGYHLIEEAAKLLKTWKENHEKSNWRVSVNVSLSQFVKDDFIKYIENMVNIYGIDPKLLRLEITESFLLSNGDNAINKIDYLKKLGLSISIDDFGTGYSSLGYLKKLSIDELKIDKIFIDDILEDKNDEILVCAILEIGNKFDIDVIAEGVENSQTYEKLKSLGCQYFQGDYFFVPQTRSEL